MSVRTAIPNPFSPLRQALEEQQAQIVARLAAVDQAEAALATLGRVFGMPAGSDTGAAE